MFQVALKLALSLAVGNWLYAESLLFFPEVKAFAERAIEFLTIPPHDEWPELLADSERAAKDLEKKIFTTSLGEADFFKDVRAHRKSLQKKRAAKTTALSPTQQETFFVFHTFQDNRFRSEFGLFQEEDPYSISSGKRFFTHFPLFPQWDVGVIQRVLFAS